MNTAIDILMHEHRLIERVLTALERCAASAEEGAAISRDTVRDFGDFFANFADKCHHAKEEDRLFATMVEFGFPKEHGPVGVMLMEHTEGRQHVGAFKRIGAGSGPLAGDERREFVDHASAYIPLLRQHIIKEDRVLYPMALQRLPEAEMDRMGDDFARFEAEVTGEAEHARLERVAQSLIVEFTQASQ